MEFQDSLLLVEEKAQIFHSPAFVNGSLCSTKTPEDHRNFSTDFAGRCLCKSPKK